MAEIKLKGDKSWNENAVFFSEAPSGMGDQIMIAVSSGEKSDGATVLVYKGELLRVMKMLGVPYEDDTKSDHP